MLQCMVSRLPYIWRQNVGRKASRCSFVALNVVRAASEVQLKFCQVNMNKLLYEDNVGCKGKNQGIISSIFP